LPCKNQNLKWIMLFICCIVIMVNAGVRLSFGVFFKPLQETLHVGRSSISLGQSIFELGFGFFQLITGRLVDIRGPKKIIAAGLAIMAAAFLLLARVKTIWQLYLVYGIIVALGAGSTSLVTNVALIKNWFTSKGALAVSVAIASVSLGQLVLIPVISSFVSTQGWQKGYLFLSILIMVAFLLTVTGLRDKNTLDSITAESQKRYPSIKPGQLLGSRSFWILGVVFMVCGFGFSFITTHLVPYATDLRQGLGQASNALAMMGGVSVIGTLGAGWLSQSFSRQKITSLLFITRALALALLLVSTSNTVIYIFAVIFGLTYTATVPLITDLSSERFGIENTGTVLGVLFLLHQLGAAAGSYLGGLVADYTHGYHLMFIASVAFDLGAALLIMMYRKKT